jgi:predicted DNA-binding transcriptional regulator AlpA
MTSSNPSPDPNRRVAELLISESLLASLRDDIRRTVESTIVTEVTKLRDSLLARETQLSSDDAKPSLAAATTGVEITPADKIKAADLRTALLLGKLTEEASILIDVKTTARLLNVSPRMVYRLNDVQAIPEPVRLGTLVRWRLAEIIEWVDAGCPPRRLWKYSGHSGFGKRKAR